MSLPVRLRSAAEQDVVNHATFIQRDSLDAALRFLEAVDQGLALLGSMPELGGLVDMQQHGYSGLRCWSLRRFQDYLVFYRVLSDEVEVIRSLHGARDLPVAFDSAPT